MAVWKQLGHQRYQIFDDVLVYEPHGSHSLDEMRGLLELSSQLAERHGYVITLVDSKDASQDPPEARKLITDWHREHRYPALSVIFGASRLMRVAAMLLVRASKLLNKMDADMRFVDKIEDGWAVIDKERERLHRIRKLAAIP